MRFRRETLQFLPYYSATASNVLYSYIAHDVAGHRDYGHGARQHGVFFDCILEVFVINYASPEPAWLNEPRG